MPTESSKVAQEKFYRRYPQMAPGHWELNFDPDDAKVVGMPHELVRNIKYENCMVYVGRPTKWGNPFEVAQYGRARALDLYNEWINAPEQEDLRKQAKSELRGKTLGCHCAPKNCHADILALIANA